MPAINNQFSVEFYDRNNKDRRLVDPNAEIVVDFFRWDAIGGPVQSMLFAQGDEKDLWDLMGLLGHRICINDPNCEPVWWGCIDQAIITCGSVRWGYSLTNLANSVIVCWNDGQADQYTEPAINQDSIDAYGVCELVFTGEVKTVAEANELRDQILAESSLPTQLIEVLEGEEVSQVELVATGIWNKLAKTYCTDECNVDPYDGSEGSGTGSIGIGIEYASSGLVFRLEETRVCDVNANLPFSSNQQLVISGTGTACDGTTVSVQSAASGSQVDVDESGGMNLAIVTNPDLALVDQNGLNSLSSFVGANTIIQLKDGANAGALVVTGSITDANTIELIPVADNGSNVGLSADNTLTNLCVGHCMTIAEESTCTSWGAAGATLTAKEQWIAQKVVIPNNPGCDCDICAIRLQVGLQEDADGNLPTDNLILEIQLASGTTPTGVVAGTSTVSAADLQSGLNWVDFNFDPCLTFAPGSEVWIVLRRSGAASLDHYLVGTSSIPDAPGGPAYVSADGAEWTVPFNQAYSLLHQVSCQKDSADLIADLALLSPFIDEVCINCDSNLKADVFCDVSVSIFDQIQTLMQLGTDDGRNLCVTIDKDCRLIVDCEPDKEDGANCRIDCTGQISNRAGVAIDSWSFRPCKWLEFVGGYPENVHLPMIDSSGACTFIQQAEYSVTNSTMRLSNRGSEPIWGGRDTGI